MKRILTFIIFLGMAAYIFYTGWVQILIPAGHVAFAESKTGGISYEPLLSTRFSWMWENLIPNNLHLHLVEDKLYRISLNHEGILPQGKQLQDFLEKDGIFEYQMDYEIDLRVNFEKLSLYFLEMSSIQEITEGFLDTQKKEISEIILTHLGSEDLSEDFLQKLVLSGELLTSSFSELLESRLGFWRVERVLVRNWNLPDVALYTLAQEAYQSYLQNLVSHKLTEAKRTSQIEAREKTKLFWLGEYGKVFQAYPELSELMKVIGLDPQVKTLLPSLLE